MALEAEIVVGVEPLEFYEPVMRILLDANGCAASRVVRYNKFIGSSTAEQQDRAQTISINRIREEQKIARFGMVKVDVEGSERDIFGKPDWLAHVDNITMELHHFAGNLEMIPQALERFGFCCIYTDQMGRRCEFKGATFLYASRTGALAGCGKTSDQQRSMLFREGWHGR